jgi:hypothetical protein
MLARALRLALLLEVALYVALARLRLGDASPAAAAGGAGRRALAARALIGADLRLCLGLSLACAAPVAGAGRAMVLGEYARLVSASSLIFPFRTLVDGPDRLQASADGGRRAGPAARRRCCWCTATVVRAPPGGGCAAASRRPAGRWRRSASNRSTAASTITSIPWPGASTPCSPKPAPSAAARRPQHGRAGRARLSAALTANRGWPAGDPRERRTRAAGWRTSVIGENARQMRPGSPWLQALASPAPVLDTLVIYSPHDNFVMPQEPTAIAGSTQPGDRRRRSAMHLAMLAALLAARGMRERACCSACCRSAAALAQRHPRCRQPGLFRQAAGRRQAPDLAAAQRDRAVPVSRAPRGRARAGGKPPSRAAAVPAYQKFSIVFAREQWQRRGQHRALRSAGRPRAGAATRRGARDHGQHQWPAGRPALHRRRVHDSARILGRHLAASQPASSGRRGDRRPQWCGDQAGGAGDLPPALCRVQASPAGAPRPARCRSRSTSPGRHRY